MGDRSTESGGPPLVARPANPALARVCDIGSALTVTAILGGFGLGAISLLEAIGIRTRSATILVGAVLTAWPWYLYVRCVQRVPAGAIAPAKWPARRRAARFVLVAALVIGFALTVWPRLHVYWTVDRITPLVRQNRITGEIESASPGHGWSSWNPDR